MRTHKVWIGKQPVVRGYVHITDREESTARGHFSDSCHKRDATDQEIREMRALRDFGGWKVKGIAIRYGMTTEDCRRYVDGRTRAGLIHTIDDMPDD